MAETGNLGYAHSWRCGYPFVRPEQPSLSSAGACEVHLYTERPLLGRLELSGGEDSLAGSSEPAVEVEVNDP